MQAIACVQEQGDKWAIGNKNELLFHFKDDMKLFKQHTMYKVVICGRKTFESFPNGPLKNRIHIILTTDVGYSPNRTEEDIVLVCHSLGELLDTIYKICNDETNKITIDDFWVIGGSQIYDMLLPYCESAIITKVRGQDKKEADTFFPNLDILEDWKTTIIQVSKKEPLSFYKYYNTKIKEI